MDLETLITKFIKTSVGVRYWYLSRREGKYDFSIASFKNTALVYGDIYAALEKETDAVMETAAKLLETKLPAGDIAHIKDFITLVTTCRYFTDASGFTIPPSVFEEVFALVRNIVETHKLNDINEYLKSNNLRVSQNFINLCSRGGINIDSAFLDTPSPDPVIKSFSVSPSSLPASGGDVTITWTTQYAVGATLNNSTVAVNGSTVIRLPANTTDSNKSTTYTLVVGGANRTASQSVSVTVAAKETVWVGIQMWGNPSDAYSSPLFSLPTVIPYIEAFFSFGDGDGQTILQRATGAAQRIINVRDVIANYHPGKEFNWAYWPHRYGYDGITGKDDKLFYHKDDKLSNGWSSVFTAKGRSLFRSKTKEFFGYLKTQLDAAGIPAPIFIDADYEAGAAAPVWATDEWNSSSLWHSIIMADPRSRTELIDGHRTYAEIANSLKDLAGDPIPVDELYPHVYDSSEKGHRRACLYSSMATSILDFGLDYCLYQPAKEVWPTTRCGNWGTFISTREKLVHGYRFKETPVDAAPNFRGMPIAMLYGNSTMDAIWQPTGAGYNTFAEQLFRFGIDKSLYANDKDALARKIHTSYVDYFVSGMHSARPDLDKAISLSWCGAGSWTGAEFYSDASKFPADYIGAKLDYKAHPEVWDDIIASCRANRVKVIEIFAQGTTLAGFNDMYNTFKNRL